VIRRLLVPAVVIAMLLGLAATAEAALRRLDRVPDDPSLPLAHPVDLSGVSGPDRLPDPNVKPRIPDSLKLSSGNLHGAAGPGDLEVKREQYRDQHGHVLTLGTDNESVDLLPYANLLASTYHHGEIEYVHTFVTNQRRLTQICGSDAAACYAADKPGKLPSGVMVISYEDTNIEHAVIHEYGHHVDNNTYNLGGLSDCGIDGDGSRRWFFAREMQDRILERLSCDPKGDWGHLLPEVYAEDYAQMVGIPRSEYHPAISVRPPTAGQKRALRKDMDSPFAPLAKQVSGRASSSGSATFNLKTALPVFLQARRTKGVRSVQVRGCAFPGVKGVFSGRCKVVVTAKKPRGRFSFRLAVY
jgi:hypothetical protein